MTLVAEALRVLGIERLVLGIHDACFPSVGDEDIGRGSPYGRGARATLAWAAELGFDTIQLGPQGQVSRDDPSPYNGAAFARNALSIAVGPLFERGFVSEETFRAVCSRQRSAAAVTDRADHTRAWDAMDRVLDEVHRFVAETRPPEFLAELETFSAAHEEWLASDALWEALAIEHGGRDFLHWPEESLDRRLLAPAVGEEEAAAARIDALAAAHGGVIDRFRIAQTLAHRQHEELRTFARSLGLELFADFQIGWSRRDLWAYQARFLPGYAMGAPPSRTNPKGQPWGYPVLDPAQYVGAGGKRGAALQVVAARATKTMAEYDGVRIDHPHGWICPWVYRLDDPDALHAVQSGARLFESPDLPDHPALAAFAIARPEQLDRSQRRFDDGWVRALEPVQVARYATILDLLVVASRASGRATFGPRSGRPTSGGGARSPIACEVLSTMPEPLGRVLARHGLGRFRVLQKVVLENLADVYRSENAAPEDWVMVGNHDTDPIAVVAERWIARGTAEGHARYLAARLGLDDAFVTRATHDAHVLAQAKLAELFVGPAKHVYVWWADLLGERAPYNAPGTVSADNWSLRMPVDFRAVHAARALRGEALDVRRALATALRARGLALDLAERLVATAR